MPFVVTENCDACRYTECVQVCPVACFHADDTMLYIDPDLCIDCGACVPRCPVKAIYDAADLPDALAGWAAINAERAPGLPVISKRQDPLPGAAQKRAALGLA
ncbi:MAG: 4Fe-4S binding protein [Pseudomonadota bacterium]